MMRVLIAGGTGAREHALAWKIHQSPLKPEVFHWPAHPCGEWMGVPLALSPQASYQEVAESALRHRIDLVIVGPEGPLALGFGDQLRAAGLAVFGPNQNAAQLESSKAFAKQLMADAGIPTAAFALTHGRAETLQLAKQWLLERGGVVLKASGLAAGKGVFVCLDESAINDAAEHLFGSEMAKASETVVLEELMTGRESSLFVFVNTAAAGKTHALIGSAVDYKRLKAGNRGPNTGGMGGYAPVPWLDAASDQQIMDQVVDPLVRILQQKGITYQGCVYVGLMWTAKGPRVVEFNCRFGDPEAEILVLADKRDWLPFFAGAAGVTGYVLDQTSAPPMQPTVAVVLASHDYPFGVSLVVDTAIAATPALLPANVVTAFTPGGSAVFGAGIKRQSENGAFVYGKGRMLVVSAAAASFSVAKSTVKNKVEEITRLWPLAQWRTDIADEVIA